MKGSLDKAGIIHQDAALRQAAGQDFYNTLIGSSRRRVTPGFTSGR
jgi:hypothetical protein